MKYVTGPASIQGSPEWKALRRTKIGASASPALLGLCPYKSASDVYDEMVLGKETYVSPAMQHGTDTEPFARAYFNKLNQSMKEPTLFGPKVVLSEECEIMMASLDGLSIYEDAILEIKAPGEKMYDQCAKGKIPVQWEYQIQHQLAVTGLDCAFLFVYIDDDTNLTVRYFRDEEQIAEIIEVCKKFELENLLAFQRPDSEEKFTKRFDSEWEDTVRSYLQFKKQRLSLEITEDLFKEKLIGMCAGESSMGGGVKMTSYQKKGNIDMKLLDKVLQEVEGFDMEQFRKPSTTQWRITELKD